MADLKTFLKIDNADDDTLLAAIIKAATMRLEDYLGLKFITQKWKLYADNFPVQSNGKWWDGVRDGALNQLVSQCDTMVLPFGRLQATDFALSTYADDGVAVVATPSDFILDTIAYRGRVSLKYAGIWPQTILRSSNGIELTCVFGFGANATDVPEPIVQAVKITAAKFFENRGDVSESEFFGFSGFTLPNTALMLVEPYRIFKVG